MYKLYGQKSNWSFTKLSSFAGVVVLVSQLLVVAAFSVNSLQARVDAYPGPSSTIYNSLPMPTPSNVVSLGYQASRTTQVGDRLTFAGSERYLTQVTVGLSSWACETGTWSDGCVTNPGTSFTHPVTLNLYEAGSGSTPGALIQSYTENFTIPFRPSPDTTCAPVTSWRDSLGVCNSGLYNEISFSIPNLELPNSIVYGISFNTQSYGTPALGAGGPYNSLNVALSDSNVYPTTGSDADSDTLFWETTSSGYDGTFKEDTEWSPYQVAIKFTAYENMQNASEVNVYGDTSAGYGQPGWLFNRDASSSTPYVLNTAAATQGNGSLFVEPISSIASDKFIGEFFTGNVLVSDFDGLSYDFKIAGNGDASDANEFYTNVHANFPGNENSYGNCKYDFVPTTGSNSAFTTFSFDANTTPNRVRGTGCPATLAEMETGSTIFFAAINVGDTSTNDSGLAGYFDKVAFSTTDDIVTYDFEPDVTPPAIPAGLDWKDSINNSVTATKDQNGTASWQASLSTDVSSYIYKYWNDIPGNQWKQSNPYSANVNGLSLAGSFNQGEGTHHFCVVAVDTSGNESDCSANFTVIYDKTNPIITNKKISKVIVRNTETPTLSADVDGTGSNVASAQYRIHTNSGAEVAGFSWVNMDATDGLFDSSNEGITASMNLSGLSDGSYNARIRAFDAANNKKSGIDVAFTVDSTSPGNITTVFSEKVSGDIVTSGGQTNEEFFDISLTADETVDHWQLQYWNDILGSAFNGESNAWTVSNLSGYITSPSTYYDRFSQGEGNHFFSFSACDEAGNCSPFTDPAFEVTYDSAVPVSTITAPVAEQVLSGSTLGLVGTVTDENIRYYYCYLTTNQAVTYNSSSYTAGQEVGVRDASCVTKWTSVDVNGTLGSIDLTGLPDGSYTINLVSYDVAGNNNAASPTSVIFAIDNTAPVSTLTPVSSLNTSPELLGATSGDTVAIKVTIDGNQYNAAVTGSSWLLPENTISPALLPGTYDVSLVTTDLAGNETTAQFVDAITVSEEPEPASPDSVDETPTTPQLVGTPVVLAARTFGGGIGGENPAVLGATDVAQADETEEPNNNPQVLQSTDSNSRVFDDNDRQLEAGAEENGCFEIFGVCWYWYAIPAIAVIGFGLYQVYREDK